MDRDFTLATELTEEDVGGDLHVTRRSAVAASATGASSGLNLHATTNGGLGLLVVCLALWALYLMFPGNQRDNRPATAHANPPAAQPVAPAVHQSARPRPDPVTVELGANGIVIKRQQVAAASEPASAVAKSTRKAAQPATEPAAQAAQGSADAPASAADTTR